jgi:hypothetical protein
MSPYKRSSNRPVRLLLHADDARRKLAPAK